MVIDGFMIIMMIAMMISNTKPNNLYISYIMNNRFHSLQNLEFSINNNNKYDKQIVKNILQISKDIFEYQNRQLVININYRE